MSVQTKQVHRNLRAAMQIHEHLSGSGRCAPLPILYDHEWEELTNSIRRRGAARLLPARTHRHHHAVPPHRQRRSVFSRGFLGSFQELQQPGFPRGSAVRLIPLGHAGYDFAERGIRP